MNQQLFAPSGATVWTREQCDFIGSPKSGGKTIVPWRDSEWYLKYKDGSVNEVIGYQLAEYLSLPVQPWLAVEVGKIDDTGIEKPDIALLVRKWDEKSFHCDLEFPAGSHPTLAGTALALACFIPPDMEWIMNATKTELRLIDLEACGPPIMFLDPIVWSDQVERYLNCVRTNVCRLYKCASPVESVFCSALARLIEVDLMEIISFSGHSRTHDVTEMAASFLRPAQKELSDFFHAFTL